MTTTLILFVRIRSRRSPQSLNPGGYLPRKASESNSGLLDLGAQILNRIATGWHTGHRTDDSQPPGIGYRGRQRGIGQPEHSALQDGILDAQELTNSCFSHFMFSIFLPLTKTDQDGRKDLPAFSARRIFPRESLQGGKSCVGPRQKLFFNRRKASFWAAEPPFPFHNKSDYFHWPWCRE